MKRNTIRTSTLLVLMVCALAILSLAQNGPASTKEPPAAGYSPAGLLLMESFDEVTFPPDGWKNIQSTGNGLWARTTVGVNPVCKPHSGEGMAFYNNYDFGANASAMLITPALPFPVGLPKNVKFRMYRDNGWPTYRDTLEVYINVSPDLNGAVLLGSVARYNWMSDWFEYNYAIPASITGSIHVIFRAKSYWGNDLFLDDIEIRALHAHDVGITAISSPSAMVIAGDGIVPEVTVRNFGTKAQTDIPVKYLNGQTGQVISVIVPFLDTAASAKVTFPAWTAQQSGPSGFLFYTDLPEDEDRTSDTLSRTVIGTGSKQPYLHSFAGGLYHGLSICDDRTVKAWGSNAHGQLGNGSLIDGNLPVQVVDLTAVSRVSAGKYHSVALRDDGTVWCFGKNESGQLGNGGTADSYVPVLVSGLTGIIGIAAGDEHTLALKDDGTVWAWGSNLWGQLGDGSNQGSATPVQVSGLTDAVAIATGSLFSLAILLDGTVKTWGANQNGQLGNGSIVSSNAPVSVANLTGVIDIRAGSLHSVAMKNDGTVWAWGYNYLGQLGNGLKSDSKVPVRATGLSGITAIAAGNASTYAVGYNGTAWSWGWNSNGQLGNGTSVDSDLPAPMNGLSGTIAIAGGAFHALALDQEGSLFSWGFNAYGQLGDGSNNESQVPVPVSSPCAVYTSLHGNGQRRIEEIRLSPNPSDGHFILQVGMEQGSQHDGLFEIYNAQGEQVHAARFQGAESIPIDLTGKGKGLFIVRVHLSEMIGHAKLVIH